MAARRLARFLPAMRRRSPLVAAAALATLGSGLVNLWSVAGRRLPSRVALLRSIFPLEFLQLSRVLTLVAGFALVISSINVYKRKRRAYYVVVLLSLLSAVFHLTKGVDYEEALFSVFLLGLVVATRRQFTVRSGPLGWRPTLVRLGLAAVIAAGYGVAGFWLLDRREFGVEFTWRDAVARTVGVLALRDPGVTPQTRHATWFLDSLELMTATALLYSGYTLFRPALYRLRTLPQERGLATAIVERHGRSSLDYFKTWPDKSFFFSASRRAFLAYRAAGGFVVVLGDPVGPDDEIAAIVAEFAAFCLENDWRLAFYQTLPDFLPLYRRAGLRKFKVGDDAIVDLRAFDLEGRARKSLRSVVRRLEAAGVHPLWHDPPIPDAVLDELRAVSDEWLRIPGRRERQFTLGRFNPDYVRSTPVFTVSGHDGAVLAFANVIRSFRPAEATIDLMRRRTSAPNGIMDYLLVKLFERDRREGYERFNLGMVPMDGFVAQEHASAEERAVHACIQRFTFLFSYKGLKAFKAKFATAWEPRYVVYRRALDLPRLALALARVSEIRG